MENPEEEQEGPVLCDECSKTLTEKNWLGAMVLEGAFDCAICLRLFCKHLLGNAEVRACKDCTESGENSSGSTPTG